MGTERNAIRIALTEVQHDQIRELVRREREARGTVMDWVQKLASGVENKVPAQVESVIAQALRVSYEAAATAQSWSWVPSLPAWGHRAVATTSGAVAGLLPLVGSLAEIPFSTTVMMAAMLREAEAQGFDTTDEGVRSEVLRLFADGLPDSHADDSTETGFFVIRVALATGALDALLAKAATRLAAVLAPKVVASAVPLVGAVAGGSINYAFAAYFQDIAAVRFGLLALARDLGDASVQAAFEVERRKVGPLPA